MAELDPYCIALQAFWASFQPQWFDVDCQHVALEVVLFLGALFQHTRTFCAGWLLELSWRLCGRVVGPRIADAWSKYLTGRLSHLASPPRELMFDIMLLPESYQNTVDIHCFLLTSLDSIEECFMHDFRETIEDINLDAGMPTVRPSPFPYCSPQRDPRFSRHAPSAPRTSHTAAPSTDSFVTAAALSPVAPAPQRDPSFGRCHTAASSADSFVTATPHPPLASVSPRARYPRTNTLPLPPHAVQGATIYTAVPHVSNPLFSSLPAPSLHLHNGRKTLLPSDPVQTALPSSSTADDSVGLQTHCHPSPSTNAATPDPAHPLPHCPREFLRAPSRPSSASSVASVPSS